MAMDPECFAPDFCERLQTMMDELRSFKPVSLSVCLSIHVHLCVLHQVCQCSYSVLDSVSVIHETQGVCACVCLCVCMRACVRACMQLLPWCIDSQ